jgi:hypothetical protein
MNLSKKLNQTAVHWVANGKDGAGNRTYASGVDVDTRWEDGPTIVRDRNGQDKQVRSTAWFLSTINMDAGSRVYLGAIADLTAGQIADPTLVGDSHPVIPVDVTPSVDAQQTLVMVGIE